jgi:hypothetical protein
MFLELVVRDFLYIYVEICASVEMDIYSLSCKSLFREQLFFAVMGSELRALQGLGRFSTTSTTLVALLCFNYFLYRL